MIDRVPWVLYSLLRFDAKETGEKNYYSIQREAFCLLLPLPWDDVEKLTKQGDQKMETKKIKI
jgi:hypothetical protein